MKSPTKQLSLRWRYHAGPGALIWQLMFTKTGDLIGQKRFTADRRALFFCIDIINGKVVCDDYLLMDHHQSHPAGGGWFTGLETTIGNLVYCYAYQSESPEHKGIWALDLRDKRVIWSRPDIIFAANLDRELLVYQLSAFGGFPERHFQLIDPFTGELIRSLGLDSPAVNEIRQEVVNEEDRQQVVLSEFVTGEMTEERLVLNRVGITDRARCECILTDIFTVAAVHEQSESTGLWKSLLKVFASDSLVYADSMEESVEKPCLNNFLIRRENLYYLKNKEELVCVALK